MRRAEHVIDNFLPSFLLSNDIKDIEHKDNLISQYEQAKYYMKMNILNDNENEEEHETENSSGTGNNYRTQILHGDLANYNIIAKTNQSGRPYITGIIDFGDVMKSYIINELAIAIVSTLNNISSNTAALEYTGLILKGYIKKYKLNNLEINNLWLLIIIRSIVNILCIKNE